MAALRVGTRSAFSSFDLAFHTTEQSTSCRTIIITPRRRGYLITAFRCSLICGRAIPTWRTMPTSSARGRSLRPKHTAASSAAEAPASKRPRRPTPYSTGASFLAIQYARKRYPQRVRGGHSRRGCPRGRPHPPAAGQRGRPKLRAYGRLRRHAAVRAALHRTYGNRSNPARQWRTIRPNTCAAISKRSARPSRWRGNSGRPRPKSGMCCVRTAASERSRRC